MRPHILLLISPALAQDIYWNQPAPTTNFEKQPEPWGWTPAPTAAPAAVELAKKQISDSRSFCGYLNGIQSDSVVCSSNGYCAVNSGLRGIGCCYTITTMGGVTSMADCRYMTACYDRGQSCDLSCQQNSLNGFCSDSSYPYCVEYQYPGEPYRGFQCTNVSRSPRPTLALLTTYTGEESSTIKSSRTLSSSAPVVSISSKGNSMQAPIPFSLTQQSEGESASSTIPVSTSTSAADAQNVIRQDCSRVSLVLPVVAIVFAI